MLFAELKTIAATIKKRQSLGPSNKKHFLQNQAHARIDFIRLLRKHVHSLEGKGCLKHIKINSLLDNVMISIFAKFILASNCMEECAIGLVEFIKKRLPGRIETLLIKSKKDWDMHNCIIVNRAAKSDLQAPSTYGNHAVYFDPWAEQLLHLKNSSIKSKKDIASLGRIQGDESDIEVDIYASREQPLSLLECNQVIEFLRALRQLFQEQGLEIFSTFIREANLSDISYDFVCKTELARLLKCIDEELQDFLKIKTLILSEQKKLNSSLWENPHKISTDIQSKNLAPFIRSSL